MVVGSIPVTPAIFLFSWVWKMSINDSFEKIDEIISKEINESTLELINEMHVCIINKCYTSALLLFRPLLLHCLVDLTDTTIEKSTKMSFSEIIWLLEKQKVISHLNDRHVRVIKNLANKVNHSFDFPTRKQAIEAYNIIKQIVETSIANNSQISSYSME